jgi:hypothetical protein
MNDDVVREVISFTGGDGNTWFTNNPAIKKSPPVIGHSALANVLKQFGFDISNAA